MQSWNYLDFPENADNRLEMMFEEHQDWINDIRQEEREDYQRYND